MADATSAGGWLHVASTVSAPPDGSNAGEVIRWHRKRTDLTQQDAADRLNTTQSRLSKIEKGSLSLDLQELRFIANRLDIPPRQLGILPDRSSDNIPSLGTVSDTPGPARDSQQEWRAVRAQLNANRARLGNLAAELYPQSHRVPGTTVLTAPGWLPDAPVELANVDLYWLENAPKPTLSGADSASENVRPLAATGERYNRYSRALRDLARPKLLDNRVSYRLVDVAWKDNRGSLGFGYTTYFDVLDIGESVGHEFAAVWLKTGRKRPSMVDLPFRRHIADPFDLIARPMLPSINTLTIRRDPIEGHRLYLHRRDAQAVAAAGGMYHVVPAGVFQPSALAPAHQANDFSLWRNIQREYSEEFLGNPEHDGNATDPINYEDSEPFRSFARARRAGDFRVFACATVLEPLTLWVEFLTVAVIEAPVFDELFAGMVEVNEEGAAVSTEAGKPTVGIPFTDSARERLRAEPLSPIARGCIELAWQHRHLLLGR